MYRERIIPPTIVTPDKPNNYWAIKRKEENFTKVGPL